MKILICIDGKENALKAVRLAAKCLCAKADEATLLCVQRDRRHTRTPVSSRTKGMTADLWAQPSEVKHLLAAEGIFKETGEWEKRAPKFREPHTALVQVADRVFEVGRVQLGSDTGVRLKSRVGIPQEEILAEVEDGRYDLIMLGAHRIAGCPWSEIENGPLYLAQKAPCPVMVMGKEFDERQPVLVCVADKDPPDPTSDLVLALAAGMKSRVEVLTVLEKPDSGFEFSPGVSSMMDGWSGKGLGVTPKVVTGDPLEVILEMASDYGLTVCPLSEKHKKGRLGKVVKGVLCSQFNLLIAR